MATVPVSPCTLPLACTVQFLISDFAGELFRTGGFCRVFLQLLAQQDFGVWPEMLKQCM